MTQPRQSVYDPDLIARVIFGPISEAQFEEMHSRVSLVDCWRFRQAVRFLTYLARKIETPE